MSGAAAPGGISRTNDAVAFSVWWFTISALMLPLHRSRVRIPRGNPARHFELHPGRPWAMSLIIAGRSAGLRLGRNARYAAIGKGVGAALMGLATICVGARRVSSTGPRDPAA